MTTPELRSAKTGRRSAPPFVTAGRIVVYVVVAIAVVIAVWALIEGGDRDLWSRPAALLSVHGFALRQW